MINILSASLPGRCIMLNHRNASTECMGNTVMPIAGQASHKNIPMMELDKMARTSLAMGALRVAQPVCQKHEATAEHAGKEIGEAAGQGRIKDRASR